MPISRFIGPNIFALKGGGYGCLFSLTGIDEEGLTDQELEARVRSVEGALRGPPEGPCLYQYTRVMSGFELPRQLRRRGRHFSTNIWKEISQEAGITIGATKSRLMRARKLLRTSLT